MFKKKFNGKWYRFKTTKENKPLAKIEARNYRLKGYNARIVKASKTQRSRNKKINYLIYLRIKK
tara:strand:+ start:437 stop:628 length:192 start_codon:yes stop_codon:yes gene_type:complete